MSGTRILIVDDSPSMRQVIAQILAQAGYETVEADDGQDALGRIEDGESIDLALVDLNMPRLDGLGLVRAMRASERTRYIPILLVTTEMSREKREEARKAGATGWIVKPFQPDGIVATVKRLLPRGPGG